jgi:hypothetical protein
VYQAEKDELALKGTILNTREAVAAAKMKIEDLKNSNSFSPSAIIEAELDLEAKEEGLSRLLKLQNEMF